MYLVLLDEIHLNYVIFYVFFNGKFIKLKLCPPTNNEENNGDILNMINHNIIMIISCMIGIF